MGREWEEEEEEGGGGGGGGGGEVKWIQWPFEWKCGNSRQKSVTQIPPFYDIPQCAH